MSRCGWLGTAHALGVLAPMRHRAIRGRFPNLSPSRVTPPNLRRDFPPAASTKHTAGQIPDNKKPLKTVAAWYVKDTPYSTLRVDQGPRGEWRVYRDDYPLLEDTKPATFRSREEAQCVADAHLMDDYPGAAPAIEDGFSWLFDPELHWRSVPHLVEGRAHWKPLAILSRP